MNKLEKWNNKGESLLVEIVPFVKHDVYNKRYSSMVRDCRSVLYTEVPSRSPR